MIQLGAIKFKNNKQILYINKKTCYIVDNEFQNRTVAEK